MKNMHWNALLLLLAACSDSTADVTDPKPRQANDMLVEFLRKVGVVPSR